jgi:hypothetical protein
VVQHFQDTAERRLICRQFAGTTRIQAAFDKTGQKQVVASSELHVVDVDDNLWYPEWLSQFL